MSRLFRNREVVQWVRGKIHTTKAQEDEWGRNLVGVNGQWSGIFGEMLVRELFPDGWIPTKTDGMKPDWETDDYIIEVKTGTYLTSGTAHEKIFGIHWKYRDVPRIFGKPLLVILIGRAEDVAESAGMLNRIELSRVFKNHSSIVFVGMRHLIKSSFADDEGSFE